MSGLLTEDLIEAADIIDANAETSRRVLDEIAKAGSILSKLAN